jgi:pyridoxamine 5'-phosphate oxidase
VRIECKELVPIEQATAYFHSRSGSSQLGDWASHRSSAIANRSILETRLQQLEAEYIDREIPKLSYKCKGVKNPRLLREVGDLAVILKSPG